MSIALTDIALGNAGLLRAIQSGEHTSQTTLAEATGRQAKNMPRDLGVLERHSLIEPRDPGAFPRLTPSALAALADLDRLESGDGGATVSLRHASLDPDPDQPRKSFDPFELNGLSHNIDRHGLLLPLLVRPVDPQTGRAMIIAGERRWRAIGQLIDWTEGGLTVGRGWTSDQPIPCRVVDLEDRERRLVALTENMQRAEVPHLELGRAFTALIDDGMEPGEIAQELGKSKQYVADHANVIRKAAPDAIAAFERGELSWTALRDSVKAPAVTAKMLLALVELADSVERFGNDYGRCKIRHDGGLGALPDLERMGFVEILTPNVDGVGFASVTRQGRDYLDALSQYPDGDTRESILTQVRIPVISEGPAHALLTHDAYASRFLAFPKPLPPMPDQAAEATGERGRQNVGEFVHGLHPAPALETAQHLEEPLAARIDLKRELLPRDRLALLELAHKISHTAPPLIILGQAATLVGKYWREADAAHLSQVEKLIIWQHSPDHPGAALFTDRGRAWLQAEGFYSEDRGIQVTDTELEHAQGAGGDAFTPYTYSTAWLREIAAPATEPEAASSPPDGGDDDPAEQAAAEALETVSATLDAACRTFDQTGLSMVANRDFRALCDLAERPGPYSTRPDPDDAGIVWAANGEVFCVCDVNHELPEALVIAQSRIIAAALNMASGYRPEPPAAAEPQPEAQTQTEEEDA